MKILMALRIVVFSLLLVVAMKPTVIRPDPGLPRNWAVLLDTSISMRVRDPDLRLEGAKKTADELARSFSGLKLYSFSDKLVSLSRDNVAGLAADGKRTDLAGALKEAFLQENARGAVLLTDGRPVAGGDAVSAAAAIGRPVLCVGIGSETNYKDVAVRSVQTSPFAFKNVATSLSAQLSVIGYGGRQITVQLKQGERVLALQNIQVGEGSTEVTAAFSWRPSSLGSQILAVEIPPLAGEATAVNNRKEVAVDVGRDRFRVLYICGTPGPEYGFLRYQFKSDPAVELVTFVILRNVGNTITVPENELSLIPFPTQDVLINQMATFDLVVFEDFAYQSYGLSPAVLYAIRQRVQDGGGFLLMGGPNVFGASGGYALPGVEEMIPVLVGSPDLQMTQDAVPFIAKAPSHPILRLEERSDQNELLWRSLPALEAVTLLPRAKPGATVLGAVNVNGREHPVLTVWKVGRGRVAALTTRTTWRWSMLAKEGQKADMYQQFWKNMVLWLTHSDAFKQVRVAFDQRILREGDATTLRVWVYDEYFKPLSDVEVKLQVRQPDGTVTPLSPRPETAGVFSVPFKADKLGTVEVEAWVLRRGKKVGQDRLSSRVMESHFEEEDLRPDFKTLRDMAEVTGGAFVPVKDFSNDTFKEFQASAAQKFSRRVLLWNSPWFLGALLAFLGLEWFLRVRKGWP